MTDRHRVLAAKHLEIAERSAGYRAFFDGCCEPANPGGTAGFGAVVFKGRERVWEHSGMIPAAPTTSNNIAEYLAVLAIFEWIQSVDPRLPIKLFGDSRLVVCQLWGWPDASRKWRITGVDHKLDQRPGFYAQKAVEARETLAKLPHAKGFWIPRESNSLADELSKAELRRLGVEFRIQPEGENEGEAMVP